MLEKRHSKLTDAQLAEVVRHLDAADASHRAWLQRLHGSLICGRPFSTDVLDEQAHRHCRFGQWYYNNNTVLLDEHPEYAALDTLHRHMHDSARRIAGVVERGERVTGALYDEFVDRQQLFSEALRNLRDAVQEFLYSFDALTGLMTREPFMRLLAGEAERSRRSREPVSLALLDIDHFKRVNDRHGHLAGDNVLRTVGQFLFQHLRRYDLLCRFGGEEFLACLPSTAMEEAVAIMDRLRKELAVLDVGNSDTGVLHLTVSVGVAALDPDMVLSKSIDHADEALYQAKGAGRDQVRVYGAEAAV
jgi:diguanylate cyclase (GGDEF)-like protein